MKLHREAASELADALTALAQTAEDLEFDVLGGLAWAEVEVDTDHFEIRLLVTTTQELLEEF